MGRNIEVPLGIHRSVLYAK